MRLILFGFIVIVSACATKPVVFDGKKKTGHWDTKVLVRDIKNSKSNTVSIDFVAIRPDYLRAEISATMGVSVASLAINKNQISYAVHTQKKYFQGNLSEKSLGPLLQIKMNPRILFNVLFDQPLPDTGWSCRLSEAGLPEACVSKNSDIRVTWTERNEESKRVTIHGADFEVQVFVKSFTPVLPTKVQQDPAFFSVTAPDTYKTYQLN